MKSDLLLLLISLISTTLSAQTIAVNLNNNWQFRNQTEKNWHKAIVPGTIHTDLLANKLIPDPYFRDNENKLQWIGKTNWEYRKVFNVDEKLFSKDRIEMVFDGLDTYADVYLNGKLVLHADNMFRGWNVHVKQILKEKGNELIIRFSSAQNKVDSIANAKLPFTLPDNPRVYARKAQYHFGWDWGPTFVTCGIWKEIRLEGWNGVKIKPAYTFKKNNVKLIQQKDSIGTSFYFEKDGKPVYCKGANWIPADMFLPKVKKTDYRKILQSAKDANMNMLRVWGGGVYEADEFYDLCDSLGIMVWQDLMFAGGMIPGDDAFFKNVKEEVKYQVERLGHHPCIVLWCGNNEIDEAWHNWGWQEQFNLHGADSARVWNDYKRMFLDSLPNWVNQFDGERPYISSSPMHGWGRKESLTEGDSHYWGLWWGLEDWETFEKKTGRFVSEYGMQAMPNMNTINSFTDPADRHLNSAVIKAHQKATDGFKKIDHYLTRFFIDSARLKKLSLSDYTYLSQCMQYYILKNSIAIHRSKFPANMGTLLWQLNDCWPVASWSITDYSRQPKAAWYAVREAYRDDVLPKKDSLYPKDLTLEKPDFAIMQSGNSIVIRTNTPAKYVALSFEENDAVFSENYFDLLPGITKTITFQLVKKENGILPKLKVISLYDVFSQ
ncbi:MAG: glycoside hydrolase family 2 protein [Ferruginibacter sp.]